MTSQLCNTKTYREMSLISSNLNEIPFGKIRRHASKKAKAPVLTTESDVLYKISVTWSIYCIITAADISEIRSLIISLRMSNADLKC